MYVCNMVIISVGQVRVQKKFAALIFIKRVCSCAVCIRFALRICLIFVIKYLLNSFNIIFLSVQQFPSAIMFI